MIRLRVIAGEDRGAEFETTERMISLGRGRLCDVVLSERAISHHHGELSLADHALTYKDCNSRNGSRLLLTDGTRIELGALLASHEIKVGDIIELGHTRIEVVGLRSDVKIEADDSDGFHTIGASVKELPILSPDGGRVAQERSVLTDLLSLPSFNATSPEELVDVLARQIHKALPFASCVAVLTLKPGRPDGSRVERADIDHLGLHQADGMRSSKDISLAVLSEVIRRKAALCFTGRDSLPNTHSVSGADMTSCVCAPLLDGNRVVGFIQVYTTGDISRLFARRDLGPLAVFASVASLLIRQIRSAEQEAKLRTFASVGQVIAGMSHDAQNVLKSLGDFERQVERENAGIAESKPWIKVREDIDFLRFLVKDAWSRIRTSGSGQLKTERVELRDLAGSIIERCLRYFIEIGLQPWFRIENHVEESVSLVTNSQLLSVALFNCFKNAIDAYRLMPNEKKPETAEIRILSRSVEEGEFVELAVIDKAGGIPQHIRERLGSQLVSTKGDMGSGLGFRIMLDAISRLGGRVVLATSSNRVDGHDGGTCIAIRLPVEGRVLEEEDGQLQAEMAHDFEEFMAGWQSTPA